MAAIKYGANAALCVCVVVCMGLVAHFAGSVSRGRPEDTSHPVRDTSVSDPQRDTSVAPFLDEYRLQVCVCIYIYIYVCMYVCMYI